MPMVPSSSWRSGSREVWPPNVTEKTREPIMPAGFCITAAPLQRRQKHENLVAVAKVKAQGVWPATDFSPAKPGIEVFEPFPASCFEPELLKAKFLAGHITGPAHQRGADAPPAEVRMSLNSLDHPPVRNNPGPIPAQAQPSDENAVEPSQQELAIFRVKLCDELIRDWPHITKANRRKREAHCATTVGDRHPAVDQFAGRLGTHVLRALGLGDLHRTVGGLGWQGHKVSKPQVELRGLEPLTLCLQSRCSSS